MTSLGVMDLASWLANLNLVGKKSRLRTRFILLLRTRLEEIASERKRLFEDYGEKNKDGKFIYINKDGEETTKPENEARLKIKDGKTEEQLDKEFNDYLEEDFVIDVSPQSEETIYGVSEIVLNTEEKFFGLMADNYDKWCEAFEKIQ